MMQQQMPTQLPEGLAALLSLTSAMQQGRAAPTTPDGQPTVAAQAAQAAQQQMGMQPQGMPPGPQMRNVAQGAGIAAQKQMQDQEDMMRKLPQMIAAMQQRDQAMDQGIASAPGAQRVNMAEGGIVGYSGSTNGSFVQTGDTSIVEELERRRAEQRANVEQALKRAEFEKEQARLMRPYGNWPNLTQSERDYQMELTQEKIEREAAERAKKAQQAAEQQAAEQQAARQRARMSAGIAAGTGTAVPTTGVFAMPAEPLPADYSEAQNEYQKIFGNINQMRTAPATPEEGLKGAQALAEAERRYYASQGLNPNYLADAVKQTEEFGAKRRAVLDEREARVRERAPSESIAQFLLKGARGGRSLGEVMAAGAQGSIEAEKINNAILDKISDLKLQYEAEDIKEKRALQNMQIQIAKGQFDAAMKSENDAIAAQNKKRELQSNAQLGYARMLEGQVGKEADRRKDIYSGQMQARGQNIQAYIAQMNDRVRLQIEAMKEEGGKKDADLSRMLRVIQEDPIIKGLLKENEKLAEIPNDASASRALSNIARIEQRLNQLRKEHGFNEIPVEPVIRGTPGGQRAPAR